MVTVLIVWRFSGKKWSPGSVSYIVHDVRKSAVLPGVMLHQRHLGLQSSVAVV
jgi:hypothetical protein